MTLAFLAPAPRRFADVPADALADAVATEESVLRRAVLAAVAAMLAVAGDYIDQYQMRREFERVLTERGQPALATAFRKGAEHAYDRLPRSAVLGYTFDLVNPDAVLWSAVHSATLVTGVSDETMRAIRSAIARSLATGPAPVDVAKEIRPLIGLTERDALAVSNLMTRLIEEGRAPDQVERMVTRYANRLLRRRAETIAIHETMQAANRGAEALWSNAVRDGLLSEAEWERQWLIARDERTCQLCRPLANTRAPMLDGTFPGAVRYPPRHVRCRCTTALVRKREAA